jgi:hypothetical protein
MARALRITIPTTDTLVRSKNFKGLRNREETIMLWTIFLVLLVLWALGFGVAGAALGNFIHILLVLAVVVLAIQLITGRRAAL